MSVASEITRIKTNIASAYTSAEGKGATLPDVRNSENLAECIESITGGGGGDIVYAINQSSSTPDGKVLIREGKAGSNEFNKDIFSSNKSIEAKGWYDDNTIIGSFLNKENRRIRYVDDTWQEEVLNTMLPKSGNSYNFFWTTNNGRVISKSWFIYTYNNPFGQEYFIGADGFSTVSSNACSGYLGEYNGVHYGFKDKENDVYVYNPDTGNFASSSFINGPSSHNNGFLEGNKILLVAQTTSHDYRMYELNSDGSYTTLCSDGKYSSSYGILKIFGVTGLEIGDYVLALDDGDSTTTQVKSSLSDLTYSNACKLVLLQITDGYVLTPVSLPMLQQFETVDCRISYDRRNRVLMIGTKLGVFAYQFNSQTKTFSEMPLGLGLPAITMGTVYCPYMSPNKKRILVTLPMGGIKNDAGDYAEKVWIYQLSEEGEWFIVDNRTLNYQPRTVFTGIATGNVVDGKYEVNLGALLVEDGRKYGVSADDLLGDVDANGVLQFPTKECSLVMSGVKDIVAYGLQEKFSYNRGIISVSMPDLEKLSTNSACYRAFKECKNLVSVDLSKLKTISGMLACQNMFEGDSKLKTVDLSNLTTISGYNACGSMFNNCYDLSSIDLSNLTTISGYSACGSMFSACANNLKTMSFPKLQEIDSSALNNMFSACNNLTEIHFRADMQTKVEALDGYSSKFGASKSTIYFDL